ncbi:DUF1674 domain-containing protein [Luteimonas pelagia]
MRPVRPLDRPWAGCRAWGWELNFGGLIDRTAMVSHPTPPAERDDAPDVAPAPAADAKTPQREVGGRDGPEPTRFGDWEKNGRCIDF